MCINCDNSKNPMFVLLYEKWCVSSHFMSYPGDSVFERDVGVSVG